MLTCENCGRESQEGFAFCPACAAPLHEAPALHEIRKVVTVVFCDVAGSTAMGERLDPEAVRTVMSRYFATMKAALERHGGTVEKFIGDAVMAVFGVPEVHEDDALRAVRAAEEMREGLTTLNRELERDHGVTLAARIGVNTGEVVAGDPAGESLVLGDAVNVAARFEQAAGSGEILIGTETYRLVRDAVRAEPVEALDLKGKADPVPAFRLLGVTASVAGVARRMDSPLVGRVRQLGQLRQAFDASTDDRSCQLFTVLGAPGVGKSRLVQEFLEGVAGRATILRGRCLAYGEGITFFPVGEVVKAAVGLEDFDAPDEVERKICAVLGDGQGEACARLAQLFGVAGDEGATEETFWAIRRFLETLAQTGPLAVVFDDIHWGEPTFLDLIEHIADWSREAPIAVVCMARPELLDLRPTWGGGKLNAASISLEPLSDAECDDLISNLLGSTTLPNDVRTRILEAAEGTPLFVEEMFSMLIDDGLLVREEEGWVTTGSLDAVPVPSTIQALLAARLERLDDQERRVIERAAVIGQQFHVGALTAISDAEPGDVRLALKRLIRRDLVGSDRSFLAGEDAFRFRHLLIRDAAYEALPKARRAQLHARVADWLQGVAGDRVNEQEEILGYHLERAWRLRSELGPLDDDAVALGVRASRHLRACGTRAWRRGDPAAAASLFQRAADLLPPDDPDEPAARLDAARAYTRIGHFRPALEAAELAIAGAAARGDRALEWHARLARCEPIDSLDPHGSDHAAIRGEIEEAIGVFDELGDEAGLASAWSALATAEWIPCQFDAAEREARLALAHARRSGDRQILEEAYVTLTAAQMFGSTPTTATIETVEAALAELDGGWVRCALMLNLAASLGMAGDLDEARATFDEGLALAEQFGATFGIAVAHEFRGEVELSAGNAEAAEREYRAHVEIMGRLGNEGHRSTGAAHLAMALCHLGRFEEADRFARMARELGADDDLITQATAGMALARIRSAEGAHEDAIALAREALDLYADAEAPTGQGDLRIDLAAVLAEAGFPEESAATLRVALGFYELKGNALGAAGARAALERLEA